MNNFISKLNFKNIAIISLIAIFFIVDRVLKFVSLNFYQSKIQPLIGNCLSFSFAKNYDISFSIPLPSFFIFLFSIFSLLILIWGMFLVIKKKQQINWQFNLLLLITLGATSNLIDRLYYGYVIDYLLIFKISILNIADIMISLGAIYLIIMLTFNKKLSII